VWLGARLGQARDGDMVTTDLLGGELKRVEGRDDSQLFRDSELSGGGQRRSASAEDRRGHSRHDS